MFLIIINIYIFPHIFICKNVDTYSGLFFFAVYLFIFVILCEEYWFLYIK